MFGFNFFNFDYEAMRKIRQARNTVWALIGINVLAFFMVNQPMMKDLALWTPIKFFKPLQLVTYMFLHSGFSHIFFNMWGLYVFGMLLAPVLGRQKFLILYFVSGIFGGLLQLAAMWKAPQTATVGASGALFGVMMGVAMTKPDMEMYLLFFPVPIKMRTLIVIYALLEVLSSWQEYSNIAHMAHFGGFVGAYLYMEFFCRKEVVWSLSRLFEKSSFKRQRTHFDREAPRNEAASGATGGPEPHITKVSQKEVDRLLDKISEHGINSLTEYERAELQHFRDQMKNSGR
jgi:membrane associated rhomboid family serine protease